MSSASSGEQPMVLVELSVVLVRPRLRWLVRRVVGAGAEVREERSLGRDLLDVGDHRGRAIRRVL
jgi:hypothetical protein